MWEYLKGPGTQSSSQGPGTDSQCSGSRQHVMVCFSSTCWSGSYWLLSLIHRKISNKKSGLWFLSRSSQHRAKQTVSPASFLIVTPCLLFPLLACNILSKISTSFNPYKRTSHGNSDAELKFVYVIFSPIFKTLLNWVQFWKERIPGCFFDNWMMLSSEKNQFVKSHLEHPEHEGFPAMSLSGAGWWKEFWLNLMSLEKLSGETL